MAGNTDIEKEAGPKQDAPPRLSLASISAELHESRHRPAALENWALKWGRRLIEELAELRDKAGIE